MPLFFFSRKTFSAIVFSEEEILGPCHILLCDGAWDPVSDDTMTSPKKDKLLFFLL